MDAERLRALLEAVRAGGMDVDSAVERLRALPYRDLGFATVDHHRALRNGIPEVIFGERKTAPQIVGIARAMVEAGENVLVTRLDEEKAAIVVRDVPGATYSAIARTARVEVTPLALRDVGYVAVVTAGTSDMPVAEEAAETLSAVGLRVERLYDVGVAGIHRLLHRVDVLHKAAVVIVVAGMEGALPSVVGGMIAAPVVAVPTSVGYGSALSGFTALFAMLTSCASGVAVVNIDSGFGAAMVAHRLLFRRDEPAAAAPTQP